MKRTLILSLMTLCFSTAWSADRIGNTPWHLVDYWWDFGKDTEFESYEVDFNLSNDVDPKATPPQSALAYYPRKVPQYAGSKVEKKQIIATVGKNVDRTKAARISKQGRSWVRRLY